MFQHVLDLPQKLQGWKTELDAFAAKQPPSVEVAVATGSGALQGGLIGAAMASLSVIEPAAAAGVPVMPKAPGMVGGPLVLGRNFAVMTGVNAGLQCAIKKARGGVEDVQGSMAASFGAGAAYSVVCTIGAPALAAGPGAILVDALRTGAVFSLLQGAFYQVGNMMSGKKEPGAEDLSVHTRNMLLTLGLQRFEKNFQKGQLDDLTLPLLTDSALQEVKIPPGPRLRILQHVAHARANAAQHRSQPSPYALQNNALGQLSLALPVC